MTMSRGHLGGLTKKRVDSRGIHSAGVTPQLWREQLCEYRSVVLLQILVDYAKRTETTDPMLRRRTRHEDASLGEVLSSVVFVVSPSGL